MCRAHRAGEALSAHAVDAPSRSVVRPAGAARPKRDLYAAQAVEDEAGRAGFRGSVAGPGRYHRYNATLKRTCGNKSRAEMTLAEMDAAIGLAGTHRLSERLRLLDEDPRYAWTARKRDERKPLVGRDKRSPGSL
jgi:hypothetical protein